EEAEAIVSVEERRDVENHEREENATGRSAQSGSHYAHPTAAASPAGRVGENPSHPSARVLLDSGMDDRGDLTASSGHGGSASGNPTARRHAADNTGDRGAYYNPMVRRMDGSADADLTAHRHAVAAAVDTQWSCEILTIQRLGYIQVSALSEVPLERLRRVHLSALLA
ncbi:hypothetical protein H0E87_031303, partial [Populus deltoides]